MSASGPRTQERSEMGKRGNELKVNDCIRTWFGVQRIIELKPYTGGISHLFENGAQLAKFAPSMVGMTIDNGDLYEVVEGAAS